MARLDRDGVQIHYEVYGTGPVILLTQQLFGDLPDVAGSNRAARPNAHTGPLGYAGARGERLPCGTNCL